MVHSSYPGSEILGITSQITDIGTHMIVRVNGVYDFESFTQLVRSILDRGKHTIHRRVLVDASEVKALFPNDTDRYRIGELLAETIGRELRIAGLASPDDINHFMELVVNNRGGNFKVFTSEDAARQWLLE